MILAGMVRTDETALICDMAETYGITDWRALPLTTAAALSAGLREDSRIRMKISGAKTDRMTLLAAMIVDRLSLLVWSKTKDAEHGRNKPASLAAALMESGGEKPDEECQAYQTAEEFQAAWKAAMEGN